MPTPEQIEQFQQWLRSVGFNFQDIKQIPEVLWKWFARNILGVEPGPGPGQWQLAPTPTYGERILRGAGQAAQAVGQAAAPPPGTPGAGVISALQRPTTVPPTTFGGEYPGEEATRQVQPPSAPMPPTGGKLTKSAEILAGLPDNPTGADLNAAKRKIMQLYANADIGWEEAEPILGYLESELKRVGGEGLGGVGEAARLGRLTAQEQLGEQRRQFDITSAQQAERDKQAIENEKNRVRQALASMQMQGVGALGSAYGQALDAYSQAAKYMLPQGMQYIPGYEPGGTMEKWSQYAGTSFNPLGREATTPINFTGGISPLQQAINQVIAGAR